jgi:hypothetical protein
MPDRRRSGTRIAPRGIVAAMRKPPRKKLNLDRETVRARSKFALTRAVDGSDNSECYCPGFTDPNSCVAQCGI